MMIFKISWRFRHYFDITLVSLVFLTSEAWLGVIGTEIHHNPPTLYLHDTTRYYGRRFTLIRHNSLQAIRIQ